MNRFTNTPTQSPEVAAKLEALVSSRYSNKETQVKENRYYAITVDEKQHQADGPSRPLGYYEADNLRIEQVAPGYTVMHLTSSTGPIESKQVTTASQHENVKASVRELKGLCASERMTVTVAKTIREGVALLEQVKQPPTESMPMPAQLALKLAVEIIKPLVHANNECPEIEKAIRDHYREFDLTSHPINKCSALGSIIGLELVKALLQSGK